MLEGISTPQIRFGPFELDRRAGELRKHDLKIRLQEQPFQILLMLLQRPGEVVLREEIRKRLWPHDTIVEFDHSINAAIKRLRDALGESAEEPRYVETVARRGYRFIGKVETDPAKPLEPPAAMADAARGNASVPASDDLTGKIFSHYRLLEKLGRGGMGEVYRARDTRLGRDVALKMLPAEFAADASRRDRFEREAHAVAALNHPNILALFDIGSENSVPYMITEIVEGETLRTAQLALRKAIIIAAQVADGLAAAHAAGVTHRDIKPDNIMVTPDGRVKILDFGLAKVEQPTPGEAVDDRTLKNTDTGTVIGTVGYMSPEQVAGAEVDHRSDIFSFGTMLYELLSGKRAFQRDTADEEMNAILKEDPLDMPEGTPSGVRDIVAHCLEKRREQRFQSAQDLAFALRAVGDRGSADLKALPGVGATVPRRVRMWKWAAGGGMVLAIVAILVAFYIRPSTPAPAVIRLGVPTPDSRDLFSFALSPDGRQLVFSQTTRGKTQLWLRRMDETVARPLEGTEEASSPFWAPDSKAIGFFAGAKLSRMDMPDGRPHLLQVLADAPQGGGGTWSPEGVIVFRVTGGVLKRVPAAGGTATTLIERGPGLPSPAWPQFLPDGRRFIFFGNSGQPDIRGVYIGSLDGGPPKRILDGDSEGWFAPPNWLLVARTGNLVAFHFDLASGAVNGDPIEVARDIEYNPNSRDYAFTVSGNVLAYRTSKVRLTQLTWRNRSGQILGTAGPPWDLLGSFPALSPDGQRIGLSRLFQGDFSIWLLDVHRDVLTRFTSADPNRSDIQPVWSPDGKRIVFSSGRRSYPGGNHLFEKAADGVGGDRLILAAPTPSGVFPEDWSPDGRTILYLHSETKTGDDIWALPLGSERKPFVVVQTSFNEELGRFSPDGQWVAYQSNQSGRAEIYVQSFLKAAIKTLVSTGGGVQPRWRADGKELFYVAPDGQMMAVPIRMRGDGQAPEAGTPTALFPARLPTGFSPRELPQYTVARDGRFLLNTVPEEDMVSQPITVVVNWDADIKK